MKRNEPIRSIMSTDVTTVNVSQKLSEVRRLLAEGRFHHLPVLSGKKLVGLISASDMIKLSFSAYGADERAVDALLDHEFSIEGVMVKDLQTIGSGRTVREAAQLLKSGDFHSVPVVDDAGDLVGIVTSTDLIRYLIDQY